jgi:GAG-pre-integrase domain
MTTTQHILQQEPYAHTGTTPPFFPLIWDTGASISITPHRTDFSGELQTPPPGTILQGLAQGLSVQGLGWVNWYFQTDTQNLVPVRTKAMWVPQCTQRLISPQSMFQDLQIAGKTSHSASINDKGVTMVISNQTITFGYSSTCNLPIIQASNQPPSVTDWKCLSACISVDSNQNLTEGQKELLKWHFRLGHFHARQIQMLLKNHILGKSRLTKAASNCDIPKCASCQFGKGRKTTSRPTNHVQTPSGALKKDDIYPGQRVSVDHFHSSAKGRILESRGKTMPSDMYSGGIIFVDHASGYIHLEPLVSLNASETLTAK